MGLYGVNKCIFHADMLMLYRYTFGKPVTGKLTVNMTVNGVGYYSHEMGHPVIKTMEVCHFLIPSSQILWY